MTSLDPSRGAGAVLRTADPRRASAAERAARLLPGPRGCALPDGRRRRRRLPRQIGHGVGAASCWAQRAGLIEAGLLAALDRVVRLAVAKRGPPDASDRSTGDDGDQEAEGEEEAVHVSA